jgi:hypothetical protein
LFSLLIFLLSIIFLDNFNVVLEKSYHSMYAKS